MLLENKPAPATGQTGFQPASIAATNADTLRGRCKFLFLSSCPARLASHGNMENALGAAEITFGKNLDFFGIVRLTAENIQIYAV